MSKDLRCRKTSGVNCLRSNTLVTPEFKSGEVYRQLKLISTKELGYKISGEPANYELFHENILVGCLSLVAKHEFKGEYIGARHLKLRVFPGSSVSKRS